MKIDVEDLVAQWRDIDRQRHEAGAARAANRLFERLEALHLRIFREGDRGIDAFARLLHDPDDSIRIDAAAALLPHRPDVAKPILVEAADRSLTARYVLSEWGRSSARELVDGEDPSETVRTRIAKFYAAVDERLDFLATLGFRRAVTEKTGSRVAQARYECGDRYLDISYETDDGGLAVYVGGGEFEQRLSLWEIMELRGDWKYAGYTGYTIDAMRNGIELAARHLDAHRDVLISDLSVTELNDLKRRRSVLSERAAAAIAPPSD